MLYHHNIILFSKQNSIFYFKPPLFFIILSYGFAFLHNDVVFACVFMFLHTNYDHA